MQILHIQTLTIEHAVKLLEFEIQNRAWFESQIEARSPDFYSLSGVRNHIEIMLREAANGRCMPYLVFNGEDEIVARANLREINTATGTAEVGYRVGKEFTRQGIASFALAHLSGVAKHELGLSALDAYVIEQNLGSQRFLEKAGFEYVETVASVAQLGNQHLSGFRFSLLLK